MSTSNSPCHPCAACKFRRQKCTQECVFAPYFTPDQPQKFAKVHEVFGASNVAKLLNELGANLREDAVNSLAYEADMQLRDPVYGCVGLISILQHRLKLVENDLYNAKKELSTYIGPQAMMPILQSQAFMAQQHMGNPLSSSTVVQAQHGMFPMMGAGSSHSGQMVIRDQPQQHQHHQQQQIFEAQQLAAAVAAREQQEMLRNFEHQQHQQQDLLRYNSGGYDGSVTPTGFNQMSSNAMSPSLALGTFDNNPYQIQASQSVVPEHHQHQQQQHQAHSLQAQLLLQSQQQQQQQAAQQQQQNSGSDEGRSVGPSC